MSFALSIVLALSVMSPLVADYVPAGFVAHSDDLREDGYINGRMQSDRLMSFGRCVLERDAAYTYALMLDAAEKDGIRIGAEDCYRSYGTQANAWSSRCPITDVPVKVLDPVTGTTGWGTTKARQCSGPPIARAGQSNHGWGRAVDFTNGSRVLGCRDHTFVWLQANAYKFGWVHPPWAHCGLHTQEPWHWEWAGVIDANLIPDYSAIWVYDDITMARMRAIVDEPWPLPSVGVGTEFLDRWHSLISGADGYYSQTPDQ